MASFSQLWHLTDILHLSPYDLTRHKMSDGGRGRALLGVKVRKSSQKWSVRRSAVRSIAWLGLCGFIGGRGATIWAQLHNKFFAIIAIAHILSCKLESAFLQDTYRSEIVLCHMRVNWPRLYLGQELGQGRTSNPFPQCVLPSQ